MKSFYEFHVFIDDSFNNTIIVGIDLGEIQTYAENNNDMFVSREKDTKFVAITLKARNEPILLDIKYEEFKEIFGSYLTGLYLKQENK